MKHRPILFQGEMVRAIIDGQKTQTRRAVKPVRGYERNNTCRPDLAAENHAVWWHGEFERVGCLQECPYGQPGALLWVRETWALGPYDEPHAIYRATAQMDGWEVGPCARWSPSIHMPRWASRLTLRITDVRVERLREISEKDAVAEGLSSVRVSENDSRYVDYLRLGSRYFGDKEATCPSAVRSFATLWESINGTGSWNSNPWVWVIEFEAFNENIISVLERLA